MQEGGAVSRYLQKQKIKRQYAKQAREAARQTAKAAEGTASVTGKLTEKVSAYIKEHPGGLDRKSTRLNSSHREKSRMPSSA